jgi:hypothetical protein
MKNPLETWKGAVTLGVILTVVLWLIAGALS